MEGTSHPAPQTGGFRKTGNGEQYAFKKVNIEERVIVIYIEDKMHLNASFSLLEHQWAFEPFVIAAYESLSCPQCEKMNLKIIVIVEKGSNMHKCWKTK